MPENSELSLSPVASIGGWLQDFGNWQSQLQSLANGVAAHFQFNSPVVDALSPSVKCQRLGSRCVEGVLLACDPPAIARLVISVIVDSVNCVIGRRPQSHVFKKRSERFSPPFTYRDAAPTIPMPEHVVRVEATRVNVFPHAVLRSFRHSVRCVCFSGYFTLPATATCICPGSKSARSHETLRAAIAPAFPVAFAVFDKSKSYNDHATKSLANHFYARVGNSCHDTQIVSHMGRRCQNK